MSERLKPAATRAQRLLTLGRWVGLALIAASVPSVGADGPRSVSATGAASASAASPAAMSAATPASDAASASASLTARPRGAPLARLFFTPAERRSIDAGKLPEAEPQAAAAAGATTAPTKPLRVDGVLQRPDGSTVVWIDGTAAEDGRTPSGATVEALDERGAVKVARPGEAARTLRAG
ncbi:MAG: hypothetical protein ACOYLX_23430, partial [Burkholderiaceae bacterium]